MNKNIYDTFNSQACDLNTALDQYQKSLEIGDKQGIAEAYNQVGAAYQNPNFKECSSNKALEYYQKSLEISLEIRDKKGVAYSCGFIGTIYLDKFFLARDKPETALRYFEQSLKICLEIEDKEGIARCYNNIGYVYDEKNEYKSALLNYFHAYVLKKQIENKNLQNTKRNLVVLQQKLGRDEFLNRAKQALAELASELQAQINLDEFLELPRTSDKIYKRNDKVKVRYQNGSIKEGKYKSYARDISSGKCEVI